MASEGPLHDFVAITADVSVLLRELCVVAVFILLFFWPGTFKKMLQDVGITKLSTPIGDIDVAGAGDTVSTLSRGLSDSVARLEQIQSTAGNSQGKSDLQTVTSYLKDLQQQAQATDETIKDKLVSQQATQNQTSSPSAKIPGWVFAGQVSEDHQHWSGEGPKNVPATISPAVTVGQKFTIISASYLRDDPPSGTRSEGKVIGVVPPNEQVQVVAGPQYSHAIAGGYFMWLRVQPL